MNTRFRNVWLGVSLFLLTTTLWAQPPQPFDVPSQLATASSMQAYPTTGMPAPVPGLSPALGWQAPSLSPAWNSQTPPMSQAAPLTPHTQISQNPTPSADSVLQPSNNLPNDMAMPSLSENWDSPGIVDGCCDDGCCDPCAPICCDPLWSVSASGLMFTRGRPEFFQMSFDTNDFTSAPIRSTDGFGTWDGGAEIRFAMPLGCNRSFEAVYWGIYGGNEENTVFATDMVGALNTTFDFNLLQIGTTNVNGLYDGAAAHRLRRQYDVHNVEFNFLCGGLPACGCSNLTLGYMAGFRYVRFTEDFQYATASTDPVFGNDPANEAYYDIDLENHLFGLQAGLQADWLITPRLTSYGRAKFGIYNNYVEHRSVIYNVNGTAEFVPGVPPLSGQPFDIISNTNAAATIGELDLGLSYRLSYHWRAALGYRGIAFAGVAIPTDQLPGYGRMPGVEGIDHNSWMLLHGGYASIEYCW